MAFKLNHNELRHLLNRGAQDLPAPLAAKLSTARQLALQHQKIAQPVKVLAWLGALDLASHLPSRAQRAWQWSAAATLALALAVGYAYWQHQAAYQHAELDIAILTDDLPIHMYVD